MEIRAEAVAVVAVAAAVVAASEVVEVAEAAVAAVSIANPKDRPSPSWVSPCNSIGVRVHGLRSIEIGSYAHPCESQLVCKATNDMIPYFNAGVFLENKQQIGKVDEILGPMKEYVSDG